MIHSEGFASSNDPTHNLSVHIIPAALFRFTLPIRIPTKHFKCFALDYSSCSIICWQLPGAAEVVPAAAAAAAAPAFPTMNKERKRRL